MRKLTNDFYTDYQQAVKSTATVVAVYGCFLKIFFFIKLGPFVGPISS